MDKTYILNAGQIDLKIRRMALEIIERNIGCKHLVLAGIVPHGVLMADKLEKFLNGQFDGRITRMKVEMDKKNPSTISLNGAPDLDGATVLLVDDVANSGRTLTYALKPFLDFEPEKIQVCVLVERTHKKFPVQPDYVGHSLATTIQEYIEVEENDGQITGAWMA